MASTAGRPDRASATEADNPGDIPLERPSCLEQLDPLIGEWEMEAVFQAGYLGPGSPAITAGGGRTTFEWLEGGFFLIQRFVQENPAAPSGIAIIGAGSAPDSRDGSEWKHDFRLTYIKTE
jgi:hypothetical protein